MTEEVKFFETFQTIYCEHCERWVVKSDEGHEGHDDELCITAQVVDS